MLLLLSSPAYLCVAPSQHYPGISLPANVGLPRFLRRPVKVSAFKLRPQRLSPTHLPLPSLHTCPPPHIFALSRSLLHGAHLSSFLLVAFCLGVFIHRQPLLAETLPGSPDREINSLTRRELHHPREDFTSFEPISDVGADVFRLSSTSSISESKSGLPFLDYAGVLNATKADSLLNLLRTLEDETGWRVRVVTKSIGSPFVSAKDLKDSWKPDDRTVIVIVDLSSPNILNFNTGLSVGAKLRRQFFIELQSRYGNQFFVQQEGEGVALLSTVKAIEECLRRSDGCKNVPGLTNDLYYLTLATSVAGGCVFGFAARLPPSGRVEASWQWLVILSPLWLFLFVSFGVLPVTGRTTDLVPLLKNTLGFVGGAIAIYLTPIFGPSPISKR